MPAPERLGQIPKSEKSPHGHERIQRVNDVESGFLIATSDDVPGRDVTRVLGLVRGSSVRARHVGRDIQAGIRSIFGGRVGVYAELLELSREEAIAAMVAQVRTKGANGVVAARLSTSQITGGAAEVLAYGTAVVFAEG